MAYTSNAATLYPPQSAQPQALYVPVSGMPQMPPSAAGPYGAAPQGYDSINTQGQSAPQSAYPSAPTTQAPHKKHHYVAWTVGILSTAAGAAGLLFGAFRKEGWLNKTAAVKTEDTGAKASHENAESSQAKKPPVDQEGANASENGDDHTTKSENNTQTDPGNNEPHSEQEPAPAQK